MWFFCQPGGNMLRGDNQRGGGGGAPLPPPPAPPAGMGFDSPSDQVSRLFKAQGKYTCRIAIC